MISRQETIFQPYNPRHEQKPGELPMSQDSVSKYQKRPVYAGYWTKQSIFHRENCLHINERTAENWLKELIYQFFFSKNNCILSFPDSSIPIIKSEVTSTYLIKVIPSCIKEDWAILLPISYSQT